MPGIRNAALLRPIALLLTLSSLGIGGAFKPITHIYLAEEVLRDALDDGMLTMYLVDYASGSFLGELGPYRVDPAILEALRNFPAQYRAGVLGPDAYPDILTGQQVIHPDMSHPSGTDSWLRHLWTSANTSAHNTPAVRAFVLGFFTHAAGDIYSHTMVNHYTGGPFELGPNAAKHVLLESYIARRTPGTVTIEGTLLTSADVSIQGVEDFIYQTMVSATPGSTLSDSLLVGEGASLSIPRLFSDLRVSLVQEVQQNPDGLMTGYVENWIEDIDAGLQVWPAVNHEIAKVAVLTNSVDFEAVGSVTQWYVVNHLLSMAGTPDFIPEGVGSVLDVLSYAEALIPAAVTESLKVIADGLFTYMAKHAFGMALEEFKAYAENPEVHFDAIMGAGPGQPTSLQDFNQNVLKLADPGYTDPGEGYNYFTFPAAYNVVTLSKLILMEPAEINRLASDLGSTLTITQPNIMLGFVRSLDSSNQWQINSAKQFFAQEPGTYQQLFLRQTGEP